MSRTHFTGLLGLVTLLLAQPPNNDCQFATRLTIGGCLNNQTTQGATLQSGEPNPCIPALTGGCNNGHTVWYWFQAGATDSVLRIILDVTNIVGCEGGMVVYGPFSSFPICFIGFGFNTAWCQDYIYGLSYGGTNAAYYLDLPVQPNRYYMVQVWGRHGGGGGSNSRYIQFNICLQRACNHCGNPCVTACNYPSSTPPDPNWVTTNCPGSAITTVPVIDLLSDVQHCFSFTAVNTTMNLGGALNLIGCSGGNLTYLTWTLYSNTCTRISGPTNYFTNNQMTGLTVGQTYRVCYRYEVTTGNPFGCAHVAFYPYTYAPVLPVTLVSYRAACAGGRVFIQWASAVEADLEAYLVERAMPGRMEYEPIAYVRPQLKGGLKLYEVEDPVSGLPAQTRYRLSELLPSGVAHPLAMMELGNECGEAHGYLIQSQGSLVLSVTLPESGYCVYQVYSMNGQLLRQGAQSLPAGLHYIPLAENLTPGTYLVTYQLSEGVYRSQRISIQP